MILMHNEIEEFKNNNLTKGYQDDFGYDIKSPITTSILPHTSKIIDSQLHVWFPPILGAIINSRSGLAMKHDIECSNAGIIDSGYTGSIRIKIYNNSDYIYSIKQGDRIAQLIFFIRPEQFFNFIKDYIQNPKTFGSMNFTITERDINDWKKTDRKECGIGSSGK